MTRNQIGLFVCLGIVLVCNVFILVVSVVRTEPEHVADDVPASLANCVAEQAYVNPMDDKFKELENAIALCDGNGKERR